MSGSASSALQKVLVGTLVGVFSTTTLLGVPPQSLLQSLLSPNPSSSSSPVDATVAILSRRVDDLSRALANSRSAVNPSTIVVHGSSGQSGTSRLGLSGLFFLIAGGGGALAWFRLKGVTFDDVMVVTRRQFNEGLDVVHSTLEGVAAQVKRVHDNLRGQISDVDAKVDAVDEKLTRSMEMSRSIKYELDEVLARVSDGDDRGEYIQRGVFLLCSVVGEAVGTNTAMGRRLLTFSKERGPAGPDDGCGSPGKPEILDESPETPPPPSLTVPGSPSSFSVDGDTVDGRLRAIQRLAEGLKGWVEPAVTPSPVRGRRVGRSRSPVPGVVNRATWGDAD